MGDSATPPMTDPRDDSFNLSRYLLGSRETDQFPVVGLLDRVASVVRHLDATGAPGLAGSWFIGSQVTTGRPIDEREILTLAEALTEWRGKGVSRDHLASFLRGPGITDAEFLLGSDKVGHGLIATVKDVVRGLLSAEPALAKNVGRCLGLVFELQNWLGAHCPHNFRPIQLDGEIETVQCDLCDFTLPRSPDRPFPLGRCESCGAEIERLAEGRTRFTCTEKCKKRRQRAS